MRGPPDSSFSLNNWHKAALQIARFYPFYKGRGRLALSSFLRPPPGAPSIPLKVSLSSGEQLYVFDDDYIGRMVRFFGDLDPAISATIRRIVRPDDVVIDVGANVGVLTLQLATLVGTGGRVIAFEPVDELAGLLLRTLEESQIRNVSVWQVALSDTSQTGSMKVAGSSLGCSTLSFTSDGQPCRVCRLDDIELGLVSVRPRLLKIDVEGHEGKVLAGASRLLSNSGPEFVMFESHGSRGPFWDREEVRILDALGYRIFSIRRGLLGRPLLREVAADGSPPPSSYDFLAVHPDRSGSGWP